MKKWFIANLEGKCNSSNGRPPCLQKGLAWSMGHATETGHYLNIKGKKNLKLFSFWPVSITS